MKFARNKLIENKKLLIRLFLFSVVIFYFLFGFYHLSDFVTADEHYWFYERIPQYWHALMDGNIKKTLINDKPGVALALVSGGGLFFEKSPSEHLVKISEYLKAYNTSRTKGINLAFRLPLLIFNGIFIFFFFWIIRKITQNYWIALWSSTLIALSPVLMGISQIVNPDALLWTFSAAAIFSYLALLKYNQKKYLLLSAVFTGFAILSKYTADILFPYFIFLILAYYVFEKKESSADESKKYFFRQFLNLLLIIAGSMAVVSIFLPAIFVKPVYLYRLTLGFAPMKEYFWLFLAPVICIIIDTLALKNKISIFIKKFFSKNIAPARIIFVAVLVIFLVLLIGRNVFPQWKMFKSIPFDIKKLAYADDLGYSPNFFEKLLLEFNPLVFSLTPIAIALVIFYWLKLILKKNDPFFFYAFSLTFFILAYFFASAQAGVVATIRYSLILYPLVFFLSGIGLWNFLECFKRKDNLVKLLASFTLIVFSLISLLLIRPFYFNYTSNFLPKNKLITDAWGYGGYEAAQKLNSLPNPQELTVWSDYYGFCEFFRGKCLMDYKFDEANFKIDYYVITRRGEIRYNFDNYWLNRGGIQIQKIYANPDPFWSLFINGRKGNFIKIIKAD